MLAPWYTHVCIAAGHSLTFQEHQEADLMAGWKAACVALLGAVAFGFLTPGFVPLAVPKGRDYLNARGSVARPVAGKVADTQKQLLDRHGLAKLVWRNKKGLTSIVFLSLASCLFSALEKKSVGELTQFCFIAQNQAEFWPRMHKVFLILFMVPVCENACKLCSKWTSKSMKLFIQRSAFPMVLMSQENLSEGTVASLYSQELDQLTNVLHQFLRGLVGCVIFTVFIWRLVRGEMSASGRSS